MGRGKSWHGFPVSNPEGRPPYTSLETGKSGNLAAIKWEYLHASYHGAGLLCEHTPLSVPLQSEYPILAETFSSSFLFS